MSQDTTQGNTEPQETPGNFDAVFAARLRQFREAAELTQKQVAEAMTAAGYQMHPSAIAKIEAASRAVTFPEARQLAAVLGISLDELGKEPSSSRDYALGMVERTAKRRLIAERTAEREALVARLADIDSSLAADHARLVELNIMLSPPRRNK
jgi:transcriptional regulator with XRE-family HTH domain